MYLGRVSRASVSDAAQNFLRVGLGLRVHGHEGQMHKVEIARQAIADGIPAHSSDAAILLVPGLPDYSVPDRDEAL